MSETRHITEIINREIGRDSMEAASKWCRDNMLRTLDAKFKNIHGKKAAEFMNNRPFVFKRDNYHVMYTAVYDKQFGGYKQAIAVLFHVNTSKGSVYVLTPKPGKYDCYTAHYFDRYAERMGLAKNIFESTKNRDEVIKQWASKFIISMRSFVDIVKDKHGVETVYDYHPDGMGLGVFDQDNVIFKTFISNDMLFKNQIKTGDKITSFPTELERLKNNEITLTY